MVTNLFPAIAVETQDRPYTKPALITILVLAAVLRFVFFVELQANPLPMLVSQNPAFDQYNYITMAQDIVRHHWLGSTNPGHSPVYSYLLAVLFGIFGSDMNVVFLFQIGYGILAVYLFYRCAVLLFQNKNLGLLTALVAAMYSPFIYYECALLREVVIAYTNLAAFYFFLLALRKGKRANYFFAGMATALSLILRAGILPVFVLGYTLFCCRDLKRRLMPFLFVLAGMAVVVAPLTARNYFAGFKALTETSGPTLFWLGNSHDSPGIGLTYTETQKQLTAQTQGKILPTIKVLLQEVGKYPLDYKSLWGRKFKMLFNGFEIPANLSYDLFKQQSLILKIAIFNFTLICPLALLGLILLFRKYQHIGILYIFIFALTAFVFIFHIQSRYRIPFVPFYVLAASYSLFWLGEMLMKRYRSCLVWAVVFFTPIFIYTFPDRDIMDRYFDGGIRSIDYTNMAGAYLLRLQNNKLSGVERTRHLQKAVAYYDKALLRLPDEGKVGVYITQAMVYRELRMKIHANDALMKALKLDPQNLFAQKEYQRMISGRF